MRVRMVTRLAGPDGVIEPGTVADVDGETARQLVGGGYAEYVERIPFSREVEVEEAVKKPAEQAVKRRKSGGTSRRRTRTQKEATDE